MPTFCKIKKFLLCALVIVVISELILRSVISLYYLYYVSIVKPRNHLEKGTIRIICVGESTTFGHPVHGRGYPEQLELLLNERNTGGKFKVFNLGVNAITSSEMAKHFYKNIIDYRPQLAIIMA